MNFGYVKSKIIGNEYNLRCRNIPLPESYQVRDIGPIIDQGNRPICVSCVLHDMVKFGNKFHGTKARFREDLFYEKDKTATEAGMSPKSGLEIAISGLPELGIKFRTYAKLNSMLIMKEAILTYGPILIALPVYSMNDDFWHGSSFLGGHAVSFVGWTQDSFIIKNSWGTSYASDGFKLFPFYETGVILEAWCLID